MEPRFRSSSAGPLSFSVEQSAHVQAASEALRRRIERCGGWIPFSDFMRFALYEPGLGYYASGATKFGRAGDFVTAPNLTPLFGYCVARCLRSGMAQRGQDILELGAGTGDLAHAILSWLHEHGERPRYRILEVSPELRARQAERLAIFRSCVEWLSTLPDTIHGHVIANEVLDALPCERLVVDQGEVRQIGVSVRDGAFILRTRSLPAEPYDPLAHLHARVPLVEGYTTEVNLEAEGLVRTVTERMVNACALWIDYGFPRSEYYHPQRRDGTLMCHLQHRAHADPLFAIGLQDITAHVDFTAMAEAARDGGASQIAFTTQAHFLLECHLLDELLRTGEPGSAAYLAASNRANRLLSPAEMGELFKVLAVQCGEGALPLGFANEQSDRL